MALITGMCALALLDEAIAMSIRARTSSARFIDNKESKFQHLRLQHFPRQLDAVFIGSSLTKNHISTAVLAAHGLQIYNLGISGKQLGDFPSMAGAALLKHPKFLVLSISASELLAAPSSDFAHWEDARTLLTARTFGTFLLSLHNVYYYREPIYENVRGFLRARLPHSPVLQSAHVPESETIDYQEQLGVAIDCEVFKRAVHREFTALTCSNGDGVQLGLMERKNPRKPLRVEKSDLHPEAIAVIGKIVHMARAEGSGVVIVLQPDPETATNIAEADLGSLWDASVWDFSNRAFDDRDWCDPGHFNVYGRAKYSEVIAQELLALAGR